MNGCFEVKAGNVASTCRSPDAAGARVRRLVAEAAVGTIIRIVVRPTGGAPVGPPRTAELEATAGTLAAVAAQAGRMARERTMLHPRSPLELLVRVA